jgi:hypothetical protein
MHDTIGFVLLWICGTLQWNRRSDRDAAREIRSIAGPDDDRANRSGMTGAMYPGARIQLGTRNQTAAEGGATGCSADAACMNYRLFSQTRWLEASESKIVARGRIEPPTYRFSGRHAQALCGSFEPKGIRESSSSGKAISGSSSGARGSSGMCPGASQLRQRCLDTWIVRPMLSKPSYLLVFRADNTALRHPRNASIATAVATARS